MNGPVLITGGAGFIGSSLARQVHQLGADVRVLDPAARPDLLPPDLLPKGVIGHPGSILDQDALMNAMKGCETVYHLAANARLWAADPGLYEQINHQGTARVIAAAKALGVRRLIATSTALILRDWRDPNPEPISEHDPKPPLESMPGPYSRSKWLADEALRRAMGGSLDILILYPTVPMGPPDHFATEPTDMIKGFLHHPPPAYLEMGLNLIDVDQTAKAHLAAAQNAPDGSRFVLAGETIGFGAMLDHLAQISDRPMPRKTIPYWLAAMAGHGGNIISRLNGKAPAASVEGVRAARFFRRYDSSLARALLHWQPLPASQILRRTAEAILDPKG
ncbi:putative dihydroflavonol-4-reductase [alpha proteobacterium Q-1]|nr:putative dihydroflavonol-4-reductase [alpha proteobacterium Q-1]